MLPVIGFGAAALFLAYVICGYPLLLGAIARYRTRPIRRAPMSPRVSIVIAVHNGERFLAEKLQSIAELDYDAAKIEIIVASDGSTDRTDEIATRHGDKVRLLSLSRGGKPNALNAGIAAATGEILVLTDVRQKLAPDSLRLLMENFADPAVGAASGELVILKGTTSEEAAVGLYWRYEFWIRLHLSAIDSIFGATGAYYAIRRELARPIPTEILLDDMYLPLGAFFRGYRLVVDSRARMFDYPMGLEAEFRRKVRTLAGNYQILRAYPQLLGAGNRLWIHFVSYKLARLLLPFGFLLLAVSSIGLPRPWAWVAIVPQAALYAGALIDVWTGNGQRVKRLTSPCRTVVTLVAAALCALSIFFVPSAKLWRTTKG